MRGVATVLTGMLGVAMATWGTIQLTPHELQAGVMNAAPHTRRSAATPLATPAIASAPATAAATSSRPTVRSIRFDGDLDPLAARGAMRTHVGDPVDPHALAADRATIEARLVVDGHLDATVRAEGDVDVVVHVSAGPIYRLSAVRLGGDLAARYPALHEALTVASGDDFSARAVERGEEGLATWLTVHGVSHAQLSHAIVVDRIGKRVDVEYDADRRAAIARR